jgi:hypothetical protein
LALALLNWVVLSPLTDWSTSIKDKQDKAVTGEEGDRGLRNRLKALNVIWQDMQKNGLKSDVSDAQNQLSNAVREWSEQSGVTLADTKTGNSAPVEVAPPNPTWWPKGETKPGGSGSSESRSGFFRVDYQVTCAGTSSAIAKLLYQIESAKIPIRIDNISINSTKDGIDDLKAELSLSTLCVSPTPTRSAAPGGSTGS